MLVTGFCYRHSGPLQAVSRLRAMLSSLLWCGFLFDSADCPDDQFLDSENLAVKGAHICTCCIYLNMRSYKMTPFILFSFQENTYRGHIWLCMWLYCQLPCFQNFSDGDLGKNFHLMFEYWTVFTFIASVHDDGHRDILCNVGFLFHIIVSVCAKIIYCISQYVNYRFYKTMHLWHINVDVHIMYFNSWSCDVDLNFLENNCRYGYSQVSLEYLWTATRILERNSNPGEGEACKATGM